MELADDVKLGRRYQQIKAPLNCQIHKRIKDDSDSVAGVCLCRIWNKVIFSYWHWSEDTNPSLQVNWQNGFTQTRDTDKITCDTSCLVTPHRAKNKWTFLTFMWPRIVSVFFKYNQQDATLYNILYYCQCCTCFGRVFRPSSGAQEPYT
jgi:hypothetical protein